MSLLTGTTAHVFNGGHLRPEPADSQGL